MTIMTGEEYLTSLKSLGLEANLMGRTTSDLLEHPLVVPSVRAVALTYDCAHNKKTRPLFRVWSSLSSEEINRFTHLHENTDDLVKKVIMQRYCGNLTACCFQRCVGLYAANAVFSVTYECDQKHSTKYHQRFQESFKYQVENAKVQTRLDYMSRRHFMKNDLDISLLCKRT